MASDNDLALLETYAKEMGLYGELTLESLIESHRRLRNQALREADERRAEMQRGFDAGFRSGEEIATTHRYISREALRGMTLAQLSEILFED
jgi:hypothetical protein